MMQSKTSKWFITLKIFTLSSDKVNLKVSAAWCDSKTAKSLYKIASLLSELQRNWLKEKKQINDQNSYIFYKNKE